MNDISQDEVITRFIFNRRKYFSFVNKTVKYKAFMPPPNREDSSIYSPDLSVCRISVPADSGVLPEDKIWEIGQKDVQRSGRELKARADISVSDIYKNGLKVIPDFKPYKEHANITPFPPDELGCQRLATKLAHISKLEVLARDAT